MFILRKIENVILPVVDMLMLSKEATQSSQWSHLFGVIITRYGS